MKKIVILVVFSLLALAITPFMQPAKSVDETIEVLKDSYIISGNSADTNYGGSTVLSMHDTGTGVLYYTLIQFNLSYIPVGAAVSDAYIQVRSVSGDSVDVNGHRITSEWDESTVTWNTMPSYEAVSSVSGTIGAAYALYTIDVTSDVQSFINNSNTNYGWLFKPDPSDVGLMAQIDSSERADAWKRPKLNVTYDVVAFTNETPSNETTEVSLTQGIVNVTMERSDGQPFNWSIGGALLDDNSSESADTNGSKEANITATLPYNTRVYWWANASNATYYNNQTFWFDSITNNTPATSDLVPANGSTSIALNQGTINWTINDTEGDYMNYTVTTSPHIGSDSGTTVLNSSREFAISPLAHATTYYWTIHLTDNISWRNETYSFTTISASENPPNAPGGPLPADASSNISVDYGTLSCSVSDPDADDLDVSFYWVNGTLIGTDSDVTSGSRASASISALTNNTNYEWYVNVTDGTYIVTSAVWDFTTHAEDVELTMSPTSHNYGTVEFDTAIYSSTITFENTGLENVDEISIITTSFNNAPATNTWGVGSAADTDICKLQLYDVTAAAFTSVSSSSATTIASSSVTVGSFEYYKLYLTMPTLSTFRDTMYATVTFTYSTEEVDRELDFSLTVKAPDAYLNITSDEYTIYNFLPGGTLDADSFYISVGSNLTANTTFNLPETYVGKNWFFWTAEKKVSTFKVYGITASFRFETVKTNRDSNSFILDIDNIDEYYGYIVVPNPGFFESDSWWFNALNDPKKKYMDGENAVYYGV